MILVKEDVFRKRPILGGRIGEQEHRERQERERQEREKMAALRENEEQIFRKRPILFHPKQRTLMGPPVRIEPTPEPTPMDLAMEEIRAAQKQREEQAALFEQMMGGAFRDATGRMVTGISQEARDMVAMLMAQGIPADQAEDIARQQLG